MKNLRLAKPLLIFDGECAFCRIWIEYWKTLTGDRVEYAPFQEVATRFPELPREKFERAVQLILPDGRVYSAAHAVFKSLAYSRDAAWLLPLYEKFPLFAPISEWVYRVIAQHRDLFYRVTWLLWGEQVATTNSLTRWLFFKALGIIYLIGFISFAVQAQGLIGSNGILPLAPYLAAIREAFGTNGYLLLPTIFWLNASDPFLELVPIAGALLSILLLFGIARRAVLILLFALYLSLVSAGQDFMSFQWDSLLLEAGFLAIFLGPSSNLVVWLLRWLLFRLMFLSGAMKLHSGDPTWRDLTALTYHYETQPLPTIFGWYMHHLPLWFQQLSALVMFGIELGAPFLIFAPRRLRMLGAAAIAFLQVLIFLTGNYTFFNLLALALCVLLLDDVFLRRFFARDLTARISANFTQQRESLLNRVAASFVAFFVLLLSAFRVLGIFLGVTMGAPVSNLAQLVEPFRLVSTYGLFSVMTTTRPEIIIEGSNDGVSWSEYEFKFKVGDINRSPPWVQPHQPRLDWQMWLAALSSYRAQPWFVNLMIRLLQGSPQVLALLEKNPFPDAPPQYIRAQLYIYHFADFAEQSRGAWWRRELEGLYFPPVSLERVEP